jgi:hypothetical protein
MNMNEARVWIQHPAYFEAEWTTRNPYLLLGEVACVRDSISQRVVSFKIGPGYFNDLSYFGERYPYPQAVTNVIGDASGVLQGLTTAEILFKMLNPYQPPVLSGQRNNAGGPYAQDSNFEIGQAVTGPVSIQVNSTNQQNFLGLSPLNVNSSGFFNNDGNKPFGTVVMSLSSTYNPTLASIVNIRLRVAHTNGLSNEVITRIIHNPKIIWGVSQAATISAGDWAALAVRKTVITSNFERDYDFGTAGYARLAIPVMSAPGSLIFTDVTDPNAPAGYGIQDTGQVTINNGVGTYAYQTYRSTFYITTSSILRVRKA